MSHKPRWPADVGREYEPIRPIGKGGFAEVSAWSSRGSIGKTGADRPPLMTPLGLLDENPSVLSRTAHRARLALSRSPSGLDGEEQIDGRIRGNKMRERRYLFEERSRNTE